MRKSRLLGGAIALSIVLFAGCTKDFNNDSGNASQTEKNAAKTSSLAVDVKAKLASLKASLPAGYEKRMQINSSLLSKADPFYRDMVKRVLKITPTPCDDNTALYQWLNNQLADWDDDVIFYAIITGMLDFPTYDALLFENSSAGQYFGIKGEYTHTLTKSFKDLKRFWNIQAEDIQMVAMHGNMLLDRDKLIRIDMILYGDPEPVAEFWADLILDLLATVPQYRNGNHPIFTFNAFAQPAFSFPPYGDVPDKIVMGDGIMDGYVAIGLGDVSPQGILAHEFGHHIQFELGLFTNENTPEATRRTELMADAYSAYYLSHARGATMQWKRVKLFLQMFFNIGDCSFTSTNHHGTPTQRMAAAEFGYNIANNAQKQGHILTAQQFAALFEAALPWIVTQ